jgi:hypothetical protein
MSSAVPQHGVTFVTVRSGGGNRYVASYFATLHQLGFRVVSSLSHQVQQINYAAVYVFQHTGDGAPRADFEAKMNAMYERHIAANHSKPYVESRTCTSEVWYHNQRVDYQNEIRAWTDDC